MAMSEGPLHTSLTSPRGGGHRGRLRPHSQSVQAAHSSSDHRRRESRCTATSGASSNDSPHHPSPHGANMDHLGAVGPSGDVLTSDQVAQRRKKRGQCPGCGRKTHSVHFRLGTRALVPLPDVPGHVENGVCLKCTERDETGHSARGHSGHDPDSRRTRRHRTGDAQRQSERHRGSRRDEGRSGDGSGGHGHADPPHTHRGGHQRHRSSRQPSRVDVPSPPRHGTRDAERWSSESAAVLDQGCPILASAESNGAVVSGAGVPGGVFSSSMLQWPSGHGGHQNGTTAPSARHPPLMHAPSVGGDTIAASTLGGAPSDAATVLGMRDSVLFGPAASVPRPEGGGGSGRGRGDDQMHCRLPPSNGAGRMESNRYSTIGHTGHTSRTLETATPNEGGGQGSNYNDGSYSLDAHTGHTYTSGRDTLESHPSHRQGAEHRHGRGRGGLPDRSFQTRNDYGGSDPGHIGIQHLSLPRAFAEDTQSNHSALTFPPPHWGQDPRDRSFYNQREGHQEHSRRSLNPADSVTSLGGQVTGVGGEERYEDDGRAHHHRDHVGDDSTSRRGAHEMDHGHRMAKTDADEEEMIRLAMELSMQDVQRQDSSASEVGSDREAGTYVSFRGGEQDRRQQQHHRSQTADPNAFRGASGGQYAEQRREGHRHGRGDDHPGHVRTVTFPAGQWLPPLDENGNEGLLSLPYPGNETANADNHAAHHGDRPLIYNSTSARNVKKNSDSASDTTASSSGSAGLRHERYETDEEPPQPEVHPSIYHMITDAVHPATDLGSVFSAMRLFPSSAELQRSGLAKLAEWLEDPSAFSSEGESSSVDVVLQTVLGLARQHASHPGVQIEMMRAATNVCTSGQSNVLRGKLLLMGCHTLVEGAMNSHLNHPASGDAVCAEGCRALNSLFAESDRTLRAATATEIDAVSMAVQVHPQNPRVAAAGCAALRNLTGGEVWNQSVAEGAERSGAVEAIIDAMEFHPEELEVQECGLGALVHLSACGDSGEGGGGPAGTEGGSTEEAGGIVTQRGAALATLSTVAAADGQEIVAEAVRNHPSNPMICRRALRLLRRMLECKGQSNRPIRHAVMNVPDASFLVIGAMGDYSDDAQVQEDGVGALYHLSRDPEVRDCIFNLGGVDAVAKAMGMPQHKKNEVIATRGVKIYSRLFADGSRALNPECDAQKGAVTAVLRAMDEMSHLRPLQSDAVTLLWMLSAKNDEAAQSIVRAGGLQAVIRVARTHEGSASLQEKCFDALHSLSGDESSRAVLAAEGGIDALLGGMASHVMEKSVQEAGLSAVRALASDDLTCWSLLEGSGALRTIVFAMQVHLGESFLVENALAAAAELLGPSASSSSSSTRSAQVETSDVDAIVEAMSAHPSSGSVQKWGCVCLYKLLVSGNDMNISAVRASAGMEAAAMSAAERFPGECAAFAERLLGVGGNCAGNHHGGYSSGLREKCSVGLQQQI